MTATEQQRADPAAEPRTVPVFFLSDSTGISAETMGNALLIQFPDLRFERRLIPDRKSTRLNSSHANISYAVFCLKQTMRFAICFTPRNLFTTHNFPISPP